VDFPSNVEEKHALKSIEGILKVNVTQENHVLSNAIFVINPMIFVMTY